MGHDMKVLHMPDLLIKGSEFMKMSREEAEGMYFQSDMPVQLEACITKDESGDLL